MTATTRNKRGPQLDVVTTWGNDPVALHRYGTRAQLQDVQVLGQHHAVVAHDRHVTRIAIPDDVQCTSHPDCRSVELVDDEVCVLTRAGWSTVLRRCHGSSALPRRSKHERSFWLLMTATLAAQAINVAALVTARAPVAEDAFVSSQMLRRQLTTFVKPHRSHTTRTAKAPAKTPQALTRTRATPARSARDVKDSRALAQQALAALGLGEGFSDTGKVFGDGIDSAALAGVRNTSPTAAASGDCDDCSRSGTPQGQALGIGELSTGDAHNEPAPLIARRHTTAIVAPASHTQVVGAMSREEIQRVMRRIQPQLKYCFEQALGSHPTLEGKVLVTFNISNSGDVAMANAEPTSDDPAWQPVADCISRTVRRARFPAPSGGGDVVVHYPLVFAT